jgi:integrase
MVERADRGELRTTREAFGEHFDQWLRGHHSIGKGSRADYRGHGERRLKPYFGAMRLSAIGVQTVRDFVSEMVEQVEAGSLAPKTVNNALSCLSTCLKDAVALGKIPSNPCDHVAHLPDRHIERDWLRRDEIPLYLDASSDAYRPLAELLIATGLRISEALALRWDDVDVANKVIRVYRQRTADGGDDRTKSRRFRAVSVGDRLLGLLRDLQARQSELRASDLSRTHVFVMPVRRSKTDHGRWEARGAGRPMDRTTVSRDWHKAALEDAGLRDMPLHALRHTAAASWLLAGLSRSVTPPAPADLRTRNAPVGPLHRPGEPVLHIATQLLVDSELRRLRSSGATVGMRLGGRGPILRPAGADRSVPLQLSGDRRRCTTQLTRDL